MLTDPAGARGCGPTTFRKPPLEVVSFPVGCSQPTGFLFFTLVGLSIITLRARLNEG